MRTQQPSKKLVRDAKKGQYKTTAIPRILFLSHIMGVILPVGHFSLWWLFVVPVAAWSSVTCWLGFSKETKKNHIRPHSHSHSQSHTHPHPAKVTPGHLVHPSQTRPSHLSTNTCNN
ncbi:hypothetical protein F4778DRAFT_358882 [Xylariomycetidae sp. FL2044]|nr:hypothetical protein F4778DRAFT_358882 [Xylariomycetidae sp. FL2044]